MSPKKILGIAAIVTVAILAYFKFTDSNDASKKSAKPTAAKVSSSQSNVNRPKTSRERQVAFWYEDDPPGNNRLEGIVIGPQGGDAPGVAVIIDSQPARTAVTTEDGSFFFEGLLPKRYSVVARGDQGVAGPITIDLGASQEPLVLNLVAGGKIEVHVTDAETNSPVPSAVVKIRGIDDREQVTDDEGKAVLQNVVSSGYQVIASADGYAPTTSWVRVSGPDDDNTVELALKKGAPVSGRVVDAGGGPIEGAIVLYQGVSDWSQQGNRKDAAVSDKDGRFTYPALPAGSFRFVAQHEKHAPGSSTPVTLDGQSSETDVLITMPEGVSLTGLIVNKEGAPVASAQVRARIQVKGLDWSSPRVATADQEGKFEVKSMPRKVLSVAASSDVGTSDIVVVDLNETTQVTLTLDQTLSIAGQVFNSQGLEVEGAQVRAIPDFRKGANFDRESFRLKGVPTVRTDPGGNFKLGGLAPGDYRVVVSRPGQSRRGRGFMRGGTPAKAGDENIKIVLPDMGKIKGSVVLTDGGDLDKYSIKLAGRWSGKSFTSSDFELKDLEPGIYTLTVQGLDFQAKQVPAVEVKEGEVTDVGEIGVKQGRIISGTVVQNGSAVPNATVYVGGMLFGDGSSAKARFGGPPMARDAKEITTDSNGNFTLFGVRPGTVMLLADHQSYGRSQSVMLPHNNQSIEGLRINLEPFGALTGTVTQGGKPVDKVIMSVQSMTAPGSIFGVQTGADGVYKLDRLAPDRYRVSAMIGGFMTGMKQYRTEVDVVSGQTATADITVELGSVTFTLNLASQSGAPVIGARVAIEKGKIQANTLNDLVRLGTQSGANFGGWFNSIGGKPIVMKDVEPGEYTACVSGVPSELGEDLGAVMAYFERVGYDYPVSCHPFSIAPAPSEQSGTITFPIPPFIPPEDSP